MQVLKESIFISKAKICLAYMVHRGCVLRVLNYSAFKPVLRSASTASITKRKINRQELSLSQLLLVSAL